MIFFYLTVFFISLGATGYLRHIALSKEILDIPNHRSSHTVPTPRGGGLAFVVLFLLIMPFYTQLSIEYISLWIASGLVAFIGFYDDLKSLPSASRLAAHFIVVMALLYGLHGMPGIILGNYIISPGVILNIFGAFYLVWLINLYNFMDGIDGIAGLEAISVCLGAICLYQLSALPQLMLLPSLFIALIAGFLCWNFPKARIFMGDAGSGFIGLVLGGLSIQASQVTPNLFWCWLILLGVFIVDATYTLLYRLLHRENVFKAHRSHAYQHATQLFTTHFGVSLGIVIINLIWLLPNAIWVLKGYLQGYQGLIIAYTPLIILAALFKRNVPASFFD